MIFCQFPDEMNLPDHSTLNRFRHWLMQGGLLDELNQQINQQLAQNKLKVEKAQTAIVDATIIQTAGGKRKKAIEVSENTEQTENQEQTQIQVSNTLKTDIGIWATNCMRVPMQRVLLNKSTLRQPIRWTSSIWQVC